MKRIMLVLALAASLLYPCARAGEEAETIAVMAVGMGADSDGALKNALRNAVTQAVGSIIDSETMVHNDEVIQDKILSHSGGFVEEYDIVGQPRAENGLVSLTINAKVKRMNLKKEMESNNIFQIKKIDGKVFTKQIQLEDSGAMFKGMLDGFPEKYLDIRTNGEPYFDDKNNKFVVEVTTTLDTENMNALIKNLALFLDAALPAPADVVRNDVSASDGAINYGLKIAGERQFFLPVFINSQKTMGTWKMYSMNEELSKVVDMVFFNSSAMVLDITIDGDISIVRNKYRLPLPYRATDHEQKRSVAMAPVLSLISLKSTNWIGNFEPGKTATTNKYSFDLDVEETKLIKDVKISLEKWN